MARQRKSRSRSRSVSLAPMPYNGDHGTGTKAATQGTTLEALEGGNPNRIARRQRVMWIDTMLRRGILSMRQHQAATEIQVAWLCVQALSSGGEIKERVQSNPKPDAVVGAQVAAMSRHLRARAALSDAEVPVVEHICYLNLPAIAFPGKFPLHVFKCALDRVANRLGY